MDTNMQIVLVYIVFFIAMFYLCYKIIKLVSKKTINYTINEIYKHKNNDNEDDRNN